MAFASAIALILQINDLHDISGSNVGDSGLALPWLWHSLPIIAAWLLSFRQ